MFRLMPGQAAGPGGELVRDRLQRHRARAARVGQHDRGAGVAALAQPGLQRDLAEQRHRRAQRPGQRVGHRLPAAGRRTPPPGSRRAAPSRTCSPPRRPAAAGSAARSSRPARPPRPRPCCGVVTTSSSAFGHQLRGGDRDVAGARRQVEQQHVQVAPEHVGQELLQRPVQHRARARPPRRCPG